MDLNRRSGINRRVHEAVPPDNRRKKEERRSLQHEPASIIERFRKIPLFEGLTDNQLEMMLTICSKVKYEANQHIYSFDQDANNMFILLKGKIGILFGSGVDLQSINPAGLVGEMGIFTGEKRSANVVAETECLVLNFSKSELYRVFAADKDLNVKILMNVIKELSKKMRRSNEQIDQLLYRMRVLDIM